MDTPQTTVPPVSAPVAPIEKKNWVVSGLAILVLVLIIGGAWWWMNRTVEPPPVFPLIENGAQNWYTLDGSVVKPAAMPESFAVAPESLLAAGDFSPVVAENGTVVTISTSGLTTVSSSGVRDDIIEREGLDYGSSAISHTAGAAALFNPATNAIDVFMLDRVRPLVLSYVGSLPAPAELYGVAFVSEQELIVRTSETSFALYTISDGAVTSSGSATLEGTKTSWLSTPVAHAWTYSSPQPTATGATTQSARRCSGAQVANLGTASGSGTMPSVQTTVWSYMPNKGSLPANYNNGTYCIQALVTVTVEEGPGPGPGRGGGENSWKNDPFNALSLLADVAEAQTTTWNITYTAHSGSATVAATDYYTLTYAAAPTASLSASPTTIDSGSSSALTWSSNNATSCTGTGFSTGNATAGTVSVSPTANTTYSVSCTGPSGSASQSATVTVLSRPNLTAGAISSVNSGNTGQSIAFTATVSNIGVASAASSNMYFLINVQGSSNVTTGTATGGALAAGASASRSYSHVFTSAGTYQVRACADYHPQGAAGSNVVSESNESDNCGAVKTITIASAPVVPVDANLSVTPNPATSGQTVTITWSSTGANYCTGVGFSTGNATSGSVQGSFTANTTIGVNCYGPTFGASSGSSYETDEWWTGTIGQPVAVVSNIQNGGILPESYFNCSYHVETEHWNRYVKSNNRVGDAGQDLITITCYPVTNPTGTVSKPYERVNYPGGGCPGGCWEDRNYARSGDEVVTPPSDDGFDYAEVTITVQAGICGDGLDNDGDGMTDAADPSCVSCTSNCTENPPQAMPSVSCTVSPASVTAGGSATYTAHPANGAASPYQWTGTGQTGCTSNGATYTCQFPTTGNGNSMSVRATAANNPTGSCPAVTVGCAGPADVEIRSEDPATQAPTDRVNDGEQVRLEWEIEDTSATSCTLTGTDGLNQSIAINACNATGFVNRTITTQTTFTLTCGASSDFVIVNVASGLIEF